MSRRGRNQPQQRFGVADLPTVETRGEEPVSVATEDSPVEAPADDTSPALDLAPFDITTPADESAPLIEPVTPTPEPAGAPPAVASTRPRHVRAKALSRVCGWAWTLDGERREDWHPGDVGEFLASDVDSCPGALVILSDAEV